MKDPRDIKQEAMDAAQVAAEQETVPFSVWPGDKAKWPPFPFPFLGDYEPPGWELVDRHFVDISGFGSPEESALTISQFMDRIKEGFGYAILEVGQFQAYIGEYKKIL